MDTTPYWFEAPPLPHFPRLEQDLEVDVVVVGAGLTGITAAYLLSQEGVRVALLERRRIADGDTSHTTAHLTYVTDYRLHKLARKFGKDAARSYWEAGGAAIEQIAHIVRETQAQCEFAWVPGFLHETTRTNANEEYDALKQEAALAQELGFNTRFVETVLYAGRPGIRFAHQAKFHPRKYLKALLDKLQSSNALIFENTEFETAEENPMTVHAAGRKIRCKYLIIATHNPLMGKKGILSATLFQTKLSLYTSYVLGAELPAGTLPEALYWDTGDPYDYLRVDSHSDKQYAIFGGLDVKTGQEGAATEIFTQLQQRLHAALPMAAVKHRWMGQVVETDDGMPFIGENAERQFIATGFCGNGFTFGTLAAVMARDCFLERKNPWSSLFDTGRAPFHGGLWRYVTENLDFPYYLLRDRLARPDIDTLDDVPHGEGRIVKLDGKKVAAYRDDAGTLTLCSPVCTHLKCIVRWNNADRTWDCPCHGSRFKPTGEVLAGPAEDNLETLTPPKNA